MIRIPFLPIQALNLVIGLAFFLPAFDLFAVGIPEVVAELAGATEQQVEVIDDAVIGVILGRDSQNGCLDTQVDVLGDEDDFMILDILPQRDNRVQNRIIIFISWQRFRQIGTMRLGLKKQAPRCTCTVLLLG